jgi:hypothetical protein
VKSGTCVAFSAGIAAAQDKNAPSATALLAIAFE